MGQRHGQPGLVGSYPNQLPRMPQQQQSIMGMAGANLIPNALRPNQMFNGQAGIYNRGNNPGGMGQQTSLMGNRPPSVPSQSPGMIQMRPNMSQSMIGNGGPIGQGVGLLNNPRLPHTNPNMPGNPRQDWDRSNGSMVGGGFNPAQANPNSMPTNQMILMNQQNNQRQMTPMNPGNGMQQQQQQSFGFPNGTGGVPGSQLVNQNGLIQNQANPYQGQQQQSQQPHFHHPHSTQAGHGFNQQQQQMPMMHQQLQQSQHMMGNGPLNSLSSQPAQQTHLNQLQQQQAASGQIGGIQQQLDPYYHHHRSNSESQQAPLIQHHSLQPQISSHVKLSDIEFQEAYEKNRIVSSSAITRAVQDASMGN